MGDVTPGDYVTLPVAAVDAIRTKNDERRVENERLREALSFYAEARNYFEGEWVEKRQKVVAHILLDGGDRAREALDG